MKADEVKIGNVYVVKVTNKEAQVRIDHEHESGGWVGTNLSTNRSVRIKSVRKLRRHVEQPGDEADVAATVKAVTQGNLTEGLTVPRRRAKKRLSSKEREALQAKADQANTRLREEQEASSDGMAVNERTMTKREPAKPERPSKRPTQPKKIGCLDAAVQVLAEANEPLTCSQMMERILQQQLWTTTGRTPAATLYAAILRQIQRQGNDARFVLVERGRFQLNRQAHGGA